jgi:hypothetical protein
MAKTKKIKGEPIKNTLKQDLRKGSLRNEPCPKCGVKLKKCKCGVGDPQAKVQAIREEKKKQIEAFKEEQINKRLDEFGDWMEEFTKDEKEGDE